MIEIGSLRRHAADAERKLDGINQALRLHDQAFKMAVLEILDRDEADQRA
ncbi:MAG TPA: hypothetical protein VMV17_22635 [Streptosporangiaceae bacterium]|nr:hypothetical protein [Streptosporangiaceae bacterium]